MADEVRTRPTNYKIGKRLKKALGYLMEGKKLSEAAVLAQMTPRGLSEALKRPSVLASVTGEARARLTALLGKGVATIDKVMDSDNPMAALNASKFALAVHQIAPPERGGVSVNINAASGYLIDLRGNDSAPLTAAEQEMACPRKFESVLETERPVVP